MLGRASASERRGPSSATLSAGTGPPACPTLATVPKGRTQSSVRSRVSPPMPRFLGDGDPALVRLPAAGAKMATREIWLLVHTDLRRSARARAVMDHVEAVIRAGRGLLAGEGQAA